MTTRTALRFSFLAIVAALCGGCPLIDPEPPKDGGSITDMATLPDQAAPPDLAANDLTNLPDLATLPDLAVEADMADAAVATDMVMLPDLATLPDMTSPPDLATLPDMAKQDGLIVVGPGELTVEIDAKTPASTNLIMGGQDTTLWLKFSAKNEPIGLDTVIASILPAGPGAEIIPTKIVLVDGNGAVLTVANSTYSAFVNGVNVQGKLPGYSHTMWRGLNNITVPQGGSITIGIRDDHLTYADGGFNTTGQVVTPVLLPSYTNTPGQDITVVGVGRFSGATIYPTYKVSNDPKWAKVPGIYGNPMTYYRAKLATAWAADSPQGATAPSAAQLVAKVVVTNFANAGNYDGINMLTNVKFFSTIQAATAPRVMKIYKDALNTVPLATYTYAKGSTFTGTTALADADFNDALIPAGASKTFFVTLDTSDARANDALTVTVDAYGIQWSDGVTINISAMGGNLPLPNHTFVY